MAYPKLYDQNDKLRLSKNIVVHKSQYDTPKLPPVHQFVNIPSHIDAMYKKVTHNTFYGCMKFKIPK